MGSLLTDAGAALGAAEAYLHAIEGRNTHVQEDTIEHRHRNELRGKRAGETKLVASICDTMLVLREAQSPTHDRSELYFWISNVQ